MSYLAASTYSFSTF